MPVLDLGSHRFLLGFLEPVGGLEELGVILSALLRAQLVNRGKAQPGLLSRKHEEIICFKSRDY